MTKLTEFSTLFVSGKFAGQLSKIEILKGDACLNVISPMNVAVYISRIRCVCKFH